MFQGDQSPCHRPKPRDVPATTGATSASRSTSRSSASASARRVAGRPSTSLVAPHTTSRQRTRQPRGSPPGGSSQEPPRACEALIGLISSTGSPSYGPSTAPPAPRRARGPAALTSASTSASWSTRDARTGVVTDLAERDRAAVRVEDLEDRLGVRPRRAEQHPDPVGTGHPRPHVGLDGRCAVVGDQASHGEQRQQPGADGPGESRPGRAGAGRRLVLCRLSMTWAAGPRSGRASAADGRSAARRGPADGPGRRDSVAPGHSRTTEARESFTGAPPAEESSRVRPARSREVMALADEPLPVHEPHDQHQDEQRRLERVVDEEEHHRRDERDAPEQAHRLLAPDVDEELDREEGHEQRGADEPCREDQAPHEALRARAAVRRTGGSWGSTRR